MDGNLLVQGGVVVDGTGAPPLRGRRAGARRAHRRGGPRTRPRASRRSTPTARTSHPGSIESHTHYDGAMWWDPGCDPMPAYGTTTVVMGNCGLTLAPLSGDARPSSTCSASSRTSRRRVPPRGAVDVADLARVPRGGRRAPGRGQRRRLRGPPEPAHLRDGRRGLGAAGHPGRAGAAGRDPRRGADGRRPRVLDHGDGHRPRQPRGAEPPGRRRRVRGAARRRSPATAPRSSSSPASCSPSTSTPTSSGSALCRRAACRMQWGAPLEEAVGERAEREPGDHLRAAGHPRRALPTSHCPSTSTCTSTARSCGTACSRGTSS